MEIRMQLMKCYVAKKKKHNNLPVPKSNNGYQFS